MNPDCSLYYDPAYSEIYGFAETPAPLQNERCTVCKGRVYEDDVIHEEKHYCYSCWSDINLCTRCETRIFGDEVVIDRFIERLHRLETDYFHPECFLEHKAEEAL